MMLQRYETWATAIADKGRDVLNDTGEALEPKHWPNWLRRTYLLTLPLSWPLHGAAWVLWASAVCVFLLGIGALFLAHRAVRFWVGVPRNG